MKPDWDIVLALTVSVIFLCVGVWIIVLGIAHAETCMTLDVQPSQILDIYDGDTFTMSLGALGQVHIRIEGVDTPERNKKQVGWDTAREFTRQWLAQGPFKLSTCFVMTLGRFVGSPSRNGTTLASALIAAGHVKPAK